jgi:hypothetical protein
MMYWLLENAGSKGAWISPVYNQCRKVFDEIADVCIKLVSSSNRSDLTLNFVNGSSLKFLSADNPDTIRGFSFNYLVLDEAAYIKEDAITKAILPTLTAIGKKCLVISTPKSKNWFYQWYLKGKEPNDMYISFEGLSEDNPFVDKNFLNEQKKSLPKEIYEQEFLGRFSDSVNDVFTRIDLCSSVHHWTAEKGSTYFGVDTGLSNDYSVLTIINEVGRVVFIDRINNLPIQDIATRFSQVIRNHKCVTGYIEINGIGKTMYDLLRPQVKAREFITTNESKTQGLRKLIYDMEEGVLELPTKDLFPYLYNELNAYSYKINANGTITFSAPSGMHDDCVVSLMLANEARTKLVSQTKSFYIGGSVDKKSALRLR